MTTLDLGKVVVTLTLLVLLEEASAQVVFGSDGVSPPPTFIISGPKRARYDAVTTFSVSASSVVQPARIDLLLRTGNANEIELNRTQLTFHSDGVQTWDVVIDTPTMIEHGQSNVQLKATHDGTDEMLDVTMNPLSGFIMIQTDKVIYNPGQTVMYRVIGLDDNQKFAPWPIKVDIKNPDLIIMDRQPHESRHAFSGRNFTLPRDATPGTWSVTAFFDGGKVWTTKTINFEVEEYVLPTFKVTVSAVEKVISLSTNWLQVRTKAVYSYGRPVQGSAVMRLGVVGVNRVFLFNTSYHGTLTAEGEWNYSVPVKDMRNHRSWFPEGSPLYIGVNVTEAGTGEMNTAVAMDTFFANPYYLINLDGSKKHFKPGFNYSLAMEVKAANGDPASNINVYVVVSIKDGNNASMNEGFSSIFQLDQHGRRVESIEVPAQAASLHFTIYTVDPLNPDWASKEMYVKKFASATNNYLQLYYHRPDNSLTIRYTAPSAFHYGPGQLITVLIISKNRLVHSFTVPRSRAGSVTYPLSHDVLVAAAPTARAVAYYYVISGMISEIVSDSLLFDTPDQCREEMTLSHVSQHGLGGGLDLLPKQRTNLEVMGGAGMMVGLLAVDKAVFFLRDERSLTRSKIFSTLGDADEGHGVGDGDTVDKIFEKAGLQYKKLSVTPEAVQPFVGHSLDLSGLNVFFPDVRRGNSLHWSAVEADDDQIPLETVRRHFPESWLFREITLPESGFQQEPITLPDSITTWTFTAVGVGREGGVCMTNPLELVTFKPFFAQVRLPYKAVRLEAVHVNIGIYNYQPFPINVTVTVRGDLGVCFADSMHDQQIFAYAALLRPNQANSESVRVIPLVAGDVKLTVDVQSTNGQERDIVEKMLYVVPEGRRVQKSITFPLDPSGQHSTHQNADRGMQSTTRTATITNRINKRFRQQLTDIMLYMPEEVIQGSERCQISACGDLMGDILSTSVMDGDNLFENTIVDAEEVIGNLAPSVYALLYANRSHFMTPEMETKGQQHVKHGVIRLEAYRNQDGSFSLTRGSPPATWLTALVLKTLCHVEQVTFVDNEAFVKNGFLWLLDQVMEEGHLQEQDYRLARPSQEYDVMLSAETLIALHECDLSQSRTLLVDDMELMGHQEEVLANFLDEMGDRISPLLLAKVAYALTLNDPTDEYAVLATERLSNMTRNTIHGLQYWAVTAEENAEDLANRPFWYHSGSKASSIEATAYALLVFSKHQQHRHQLQARGSLRSRSWSRSRRFSPQPVPRAWPINLDAVAGWLIQKRNSRGAFIGAMDTAVATQALSEYSLNKMGVAEVDLHCNVTTNPVQNYTHSFNFNEQNAITPKSLSNVPMGRQLLVETRGTGLGQMQVRVQYNVPVEANAHCTYNVTVTRRAVSYNPYTLEGDEVCQYCNMGCNDDDGDDDDNNNDDDDNGGDVGRGNSDNNGQGSSGRMWRERARPRPRPQVPSSRRQKREHRQRRQIIASRPIICIQVCLRSTDRAFADRTILDISMLTGFQPLGRDLERIYSMKERLSLASLTYVAESTSVQMKFNEIPHNRDTCVSFRAIEQHDVDRRNPALVTVRSHQDPEPTCVTTYDPVVSEVNLEVYCASNQSNNQGQCRCFSGLCGECFSRTADVSYNKIRSLVCTSEYIYKVRRPQSELSDDWVDMSMDVLEIVKNGSVPVDQVIHLVTPRTCTCPHRADMSPSLYFFGSEVDIFVDRNNNRRKTYLVDHTKTFVSAESEHGRNNRIADFIRMALSSCVN